MESYIVRVYHRDPQDPALLNGVVEVVQTGEKFSFHESAQLWRILASTEPEPARPGPAGGARAGARKRRRTPP